MKRLFNILSFLMLLFLLTAEDCSDNNKEKTYLEKQTDIFQNMEDEFLNDEIKPEILSAFEKHAVQKLIDLVDFINIYSDTSLSFEFRVQAKQMIEKSFKSEKDRQIYYQCFSFIEKSTDKVLYYSENATTFYTEIDSIIITNSFQKTINSGYSGALQFSQKLYNIYSGDTILFAFSKYQLEIFALKIEKDFGTSSQEVWAVFLGEIK